MAELSTNTRRQKRHRIKLFVVVVGVYAIASILDLSLTTKATTCVAATQEENAMKQNLSDLNVLIQATIDLPALQAYYHVEQDPTRKPLVILMNKVLSQQLSLSKFGVPVVFLSRAEIGDRPYLEVTKLTENEAAAVIEFLYPIEGIRGTVHFKKTGETWTVETHELVER